MTKVQRMAMSPQFRVSSVSPRSLAKSLNGIRDWFGNFMQLIDTVKQFSGTRGI